MAPISDGIQPHFVSNSFIWQKLLDRVCSFSRKYLATKNLCCVIETVYAALRGEWRGHIRARSILSKYITMSKHKQILFIKKSQSFFFFFFFKGKDPHKHQHSTNDANRLPMSHDSNSNGSPLYNISNLSVSVLHVQSFASASTSSQNLRTQSTSQQHHAAL